ncbi:MAG: hypothetical protein FI729_01260 [SAR202 cluster bacterium]|nr:hypothetical protein [SAR202 cluster bacterium]|tara:strand:- start:124 stop:564 length:441 start_codon:yes stop_codon:yes gene_type:complete
MAFSHTNQIAFTYTAGGTSAKKTISRTETSGAEMNVSEAVTTDASTATTPIDIDGFEFATKAKAVSVYLRIDGFDCELKGGASGATKMADLVDGEPYVWSGTGGDFPAGNENPMVDATDMLKVVPASDAGLETAGTLTVKVLYDPT